MGRCAVAALDLLHAQGTCHPWLLRGQAARLGGLPRLRAARAEERRNAVRAGEGGRIGQHQGRAQRPGAADDRAPARSGTRCRGRASGAAAVPVALPRAAGLSALWGGAAISAAVGGAAAIPPAIRGATAIPAALRAAAAIPAAAISAAAICGPAAVLPAARLRAALLSPVLSPLT